jgi:hypothetical protein
MNKPRTQSERSVVVVDHDLLRLSGDWGFLACRPCEPECGMPASPYEQFRP